MSESTVELTQQNDRVLLPVQAQPGARRNGITGAHDGRLRVAVTQAPEKGKANQALVKVLAKALDLKRSQIELVAGETSAKKRFAISNIELAELRDRIENLLSSP